MFKLVIVLIMFGLASCTQSQRNYLIKQAQIEECATKYSQQHGTGISDSYLDGVYECRYWVRIDNERKSGKPVNFKRLPVEEAQFVPGWSSKDYRKFYEARDQQ